MRQDTATVDRAPSAAEHRQRQLEQESEAARTDAAKPMGGLYQRVRQLPAGRELTVRAEVATKMVDAGRAELVGEPFEPPRTTTQLRGADWRDPALMAAELRARQSSRGKRRSADRRRLIEGALHDAAHPDAPQLSDADYAQAIRELEQLAAQGGKLTLEVVGHSGGVAHRVDGRLSHGPPSAIAAAEQAAVTAFAVTVSQQTAESLRLFT